jgi:hypothetical protein
MNNQEIKKILENKGFPEERLDSMIRDIYDFNIFLAKRFPEVSILNAGRKEAERYSDFLVKKRKNKRQSYMNLKDFAYNTQNSESYTVFSELINKGVFSKKR